MLQAHLVCQAISHNAHELKLAVENADLSLKSKAWNDSKVDAHHAIIPTPKQSSSRSLSGQEEKIYQMIARQYVMQFYPSAMYAESKLEFDIAGGCFVAKGRVLIIEGWKALFSNNKSSAQRQDSDESDPVPALQNGQTLICREGEIKDRKTEPPQHFTEATILKAMTGIARFVADKELKKILRDTDGLGTEATRAGILDTLFKRQLLLRQGKNILSSPAGKGLIHALPVESTYPDMTAHWEHQLQAMAEKQQPYRPFMNDLEQKIDGLIQQIKTSGIPDSLRSLPKVDKPAFRRKGKSNKKYTKANKA